MSNTQHEGAGRMLRLFTAALISFALAACEAKLVLEHVDEQRQQPLQPTDLFQAATSNGAVLVGVGAYGVIVVSDDAGESWRRQKLESQPTLIDVTHCPDDSLAAVATEGQVWVSQDNGGSWTQHETGTAEVPQAMTCDPTGRLWVVGSFSTIMNSSDLGSSWQTYSFDEDLILTDVQFFSAAQGLVIGEYGAMALTLDGGKNWEMAEPAPDEFYPMASLFLNMEHGWMAGLNGTVYHTADGGNTWVKQDSDTTAPLYGMVEADGKVYAVGDFGTLMEYQEGGEGRWVNSPVSVASRSYLRAVQPIPGGSLLVGGGAGVLKVVSPGAGNGG
jgi:photosystem II stability/assembly factor-like uncharacterized protein